MTRIQRRYLEAVLGMDGLQALVLVVDSPLAMNLTPQRASLEPALPCVRACVQ